MIQLSTGLSFVQYAYEGGPLRFTVTFPFLKREHVRVLVGDPASPRMVIPKWIDNSTIEIPDQTPDLTAPYAVTLRRLTPFDKQSVLFQEGASLHAKQLNTALKQLLYAQQELREFPTDSTGNPGGGGPGGSNGPFPDIQTIIDLVTQSPAFLILQEKIPDVDANAELIMEELLRSNGFFDLTRSFGDRLSTAVTRISLTESETQALAEQYTELFTRFISTEVDIAAQFLQINTALATEAEARVTSLTDLYAQVTTERGTAVAQAVSQTTALVNAVDARVTQVNGTVVAHSGQIAATNTSLSAVANSQGANTEWRQLFAAQFGGPGTTGTSVAAAVKQQIDTKVTSAEASAISNTSVTAFANGTFAALQQSYTAYVNSNDGRWDATWALRINGGDVNNPVVAGIALSANPAGSDFVVQVDRFAIVSPTQYGQKKFPFVVGTVGGVATVGITGQLLVDGSITANKLTVNSLSAITGNLGTVNGGTFKTHTLDESGNVINALEFRAEMSNIGDWPLWVGSGVKNANNAVFYVDRLGNAAFKGTVSAPNIVGAYQVAVPVAWSGSVTPPAGGATLVQFTVPAPLRPGEAHATAISLAVNVQSVSGDNGIYELAVQRLNASVWENVIVARLNHGSGHGINQALSCIAPVTTAAITYRVITTGIQNGERFRVQTVMGFAMGIR